VHSNGSERRFRYAQRKPYEQVSPVVRGTIVTGAGSAGHIEGGKGRIGLVDENAGSQTEKMLLVANAAEMASSNSGTPTARNTGRQRSERSEATGDVGGETMVDSVLHVVAQRDSLRCAFNERRTRV